MNTAYNYDSVSRLLSVLHQTGTTTLDGATYTYDNASNRTSKGNSLNGITEQYTYDPLYQLTQVTQGTTTTESYSYDVVGNRLSSLGMSTYSYNASNQLTSTPAATFTYDSNGNTLTKTDSTGARTYTWDFENRLTSVVLPGTGGTVTFKYDPFGRRIQKGSSNGTTNYLYDGTNSVEEVDQSGSVLARYAQGAGIDEPLADLRSGSAAYYEQDGLNSVTSLSNSTGALANTYTYNAFGNLTASTGTTANPLQYTGRDYDQETGLRYYRARYYDPTVGRFISEDPIGFDGGMNFYSYVANNPIGFVDPSGLTLSPAQCAELLRHILVKVEILEEKLAKYDPISDGRGGHAYRIGTTLKYTQPGKHYDNIILLQASLWVDITRYQLECKNGPPCPVRVYEPVGRKIPKPVFPPTVIPILDPIADWIWDRIQEIKNFRPPQPCQQCSLVPVPYPVPTPVPVP